MKFEAKGETTHILKEYTIYTTSKWNSSYPTFQNTKLYTDYKFLQLVFYNPPVQVSSQLITMFDKLIRKLYTDKTVHGLLTI